MTIYIDIILLENLCMNYIILMATGMVSKSHINQIRILVSSLIGGIYAVISMLSILNASITLVLKILLSISMVYIAFNPKNFKQIFKELVIFYLVSFAFGGCAFYLLYFIKPQEILMKNGIYIGTYPLKIALMGGILGFAVVNIAFKLIKGKLSKKDIFCNIEVKFNGKSAKMKALIDTGNLLKDPLSKMSVIVVEAEKIEEIIPKEIIKKITLILGGGKDENLEEEYISKFRIIPFSSLGNQNGLLLGFIADNVIISSDEYEKNIPKVIIGIYENSLTKNKLYSALVGIDVIERNDDKNEFFAVTKK